MLARLGGVVADAAEDLDPHAALELGVGGDALAQHAGRGPGRRGPLSEPGLVVDAGRAEPGALHGDADQLAQVVRRPVDAVAEPDDLELGGDDGQPPDVHRHRVRVVEEPGVRAQLAHVRGERREHGERAQRAEDPADAGRVADRLAQPVPRRELEVRDRVAAMPPTWIMLMTKSAPSSAARRSGVATTVAPGAELAGRPGAAVAAATSSRSGSMSCSTRSQRRQLGETEEVGEQLPGEDDAARADERDADHGVDHPWARARCARIRSEFALKRSV